MTTKSVSVPQAPKDDRKPPGAADRVAIEAAQKRIAERSPRVTVRVRQDPKLGKFDVEGGDHTDHAGWFARLQELFGTRGMAFPVSQLNQIIAAAQEDGKVDTIRVNAMLAMVEAVRPQNEMQAALAVQMAITHYATVVAMRRAMRVDQISQFDSAGNMAVKMARTFALQAEALAKLQRGGEQTVRVVHVHPGAQAIVGNVSAGARAIGAPGGGGTDENQNQPYATAIAGADGSGAMPALRCADEEREPVRLASGGR